MRRASRGLAAREDGQVYPRAVIGEPHPGLHPQHERMVVIRAFPETKAIVALLNAGHPVLVVMRVSDEERRRVLDLLAGWALGSTGDLDRVGPNTILALPPGCAAVRLCRTGFVSAVEEAFASDGPNPLSREDEDLLLPLAVAGSESARRKLVDAYAEFATVFALRIRPQSVSEAAAVRAAQQELERLVSFPSRGPLLACLVEGIVKLLLP